MGKARKIGAKFAYSPMLANFRYIIFSFKLLRETGRKEITIRMLNLIYIKNFKLHYQ